MKSSLIHLGCGPHKLPGFQNFDREVDITKPLPFASDSAELIFCEHCVEHVTGPEGFRFMKECHRVLSRGGVLRLCVPELVRLPSAKREDIIVNHGHLMVYCEESLRLMLETAGFHSESITRTGRKVCDSHWKTIGIELDTLETLRMEATK